MTSNGSATPTNQLIIFFIILNTRVVKMFSWNDNNIENWRRKFLSIGKYSFKISVGLQAAASEMFAKFN